MNSEQLIELGLIFLLALYFIFRKKPLRRFSIGTREKTYLRENVGYYLDLSSEKQLAFEAKLIDFLGNVKVEGVGFEVQTNDKLLVACSAVIPIFGFDDWKYTNLTNVVLYPDTFNKDFQYEGKDRQLLGMVGNGYLNGQMVLSLASLKQGFTNSAGKENTGIHEFVHLLDNTDGKTDGLPERFLSHAYMIPWVKMIHQEINKIEENKSDINPYAITNEAEFFAVASEYFFEKPTLLKEKHPELYGYLSQIFAQNLAK